MSMYGKPLKPYSRMIHQSGRVFRIHSRGLRDPIGVVHAPVAKHLFSDTPRRVDMKQRIQHKTRERRHYLARAGADAHRLAVCRTRSERVKKTGGLGVEPLFGSVV